MMKTQKSRCQNIKKGLSERIIYKLSFNEYVDISWLNKRIWEWGRHGRHFITLQVFVLAFTILLLLADILIVMN